MKKNFFKKLASVTALALVVTSAAPAGVASAATAPSLNVSSKTLYVGKKFDINIKNKPSSATYTWSSSDKTVATVAKGGIVTAKKSGTATVKVVIKTKKTSKTLKATFTVKESATKVAISNPTDTVGIGEKVYDFNRTLTTKSGGKSTDKTFWVITDDTAGTTVDANGVISTTKPGEFKIQAVTATSKANFEAGVTTATSDVLTVKVPVAVAGVKQTTVNKLIVTFNTDVSKLVKASDLAIENVATHSVVNVKGIEFSADGKVATVETYLNFADAKEYSLTYAGKETKFTASVGAVASITLDTQTVVFGKETQIKYTLFDANGVDVTSVADTTRVTTDVDTTKGYTTGTEAAKKITLFTKGDTAKVKVTYHTYKYENNAEVTYSAEGVITAVDETATTIGNYDNYTIAKTEPNWAKLTENNTKLAVNDKDYKIFVKATDSAKNTITSSSLTFTSANNSILLVANDGSLTPVKEGTTYVVASYKGNAVWTFPVTVVADRKATSVIVKDSKYSVTVSNAVAAADQQTVEVEVKDQFGSALTAGKVEVTKVTGPTGTAPAYTEANGKITFSGVNGGVSATKGTYTYVLKVDGLYFNVSVNVAEPSSTLASTYKAVVSTSSVDTVIASDSTITNGVVNGKSVVISVGEYKGDVLFSKATPEKVTVVKPDNSEVIVPVTNGVATFDTAVVPGSAIVKVATGTYKVVVDYKGAKIPAVFTVTDTQTAPTVNVKSLTSKAVTASAIAADVLEIKGADGKLVSIVSVNAKYAGATKATLSVGDTLYIQSVVVQETIGANVIEYTVTIERPITVVQ